VPLFTSAKERLGENGWIIQSSGTTNTLYGVSFADVNNGTAVGASGTILRTKRDVGTTWVSQTRRTTNALLGVSLPTLVTEAPLAKMETISRTTDGGANWASQASATTNNLMRFPYRYK